MSKKKPYTYAPDEVSLAMLDLVEDGLLVTVSQDGSGMYIVSVRDATVDPSSSGVWQVRARAADLREAMLVVQQRAHRHPSY